eukprot:2908049-Karenia_brevis.AAC.1
MGNEARVDFSWVHFRHIPSKHDDSVGAEGEPLPIPSLKHAMTLGFNVSMGDEERIDFHGLSTHTFEANVMMVLVLQGKRCPGLAYKMQ